MAFKNKDIIDLALKAIETHKLFFIEDVIAYLPISKSGFYKKRLHEVDAIKEAIERNRVEVKVSLRSKWYRSDNPSLQIALMKLICTNSEAERLNNSRQSVDVTTGGERINEIKITKVVMDKRNDDA